MSKQFPQCPLYNHSSCKELDNPALCALVRKDNTCLKINPNPLSKEEKEKAIQMICDLKEQRMSQQKIADLLNVRGIATFTGRGKWTIGKVNSLFQSMKKCSPKKHS
jgi:hypothetical protein